MSGTSSTLAQSQRGSTKTRSGLHVCFISTVDNFQMTSRGDRIIKDASAVMTVTVTTNAPITTLDININKYVIQSKIEITCMIRAPGACWFHFGDVIQVSGNLAAWTLNTAPKETTTYNPTTYLETSLQDIQR